MAKITLSRKAAAPTYRTGRGNRLFTIVDGCNPAVHTPALIPGSGTGMTRTGCNHIAAPRTAQMLLTVSTFVTPGGTLLSMDKKTFESRNGSARKAPVGTAFTVSIGGHTVEVRV